MGGREHNGEKRNGPPRRPWNTIVSVLMLYAFHFGCVVVWIWQHAPNNNEWAHLAAGLEYLHGGSLELYAVNPPLPRYLGALPGLLLGLEPVADAPLTESSPHSVSRPEFERGRRLADIYGEEALCALLWGRTLQAAFACSGVVAIWLWVRGLFGTGRAWIAAALWCTSPTLLTWNGTLNTDGMATAATAWTAFLFWRYLHAPRMLAACAVGLGWAAAFLSKFTLALLGPVFAVSVLMHRSWFRHASPGRPRWTHAMGALVVLWLATVLAYQGQRMFEGFGSFQFRSAALQSLQQAVDRTPLNRLRKVPLPVPAALLVGIDTQLVDFDQPRLSYLHGQAQKGGWWYYYAYCFVVKEPEPLVALVVLGGATTLYGTLRKRPWARLVVVHSLPGVAVAALVSSQTAFSFHYRYFLPVYPFIILIAIAALPQQHLFRSALAAFLVGWAGGSMASVAPHWESHFNALAGGPPRGEFHLRDWGLDWGQDSPAAARWAQGCPDPCPVYAVGLANPELYGLQHWRDVDQVCGSQASHVLTPGWYIVSLCVLYDQGEDRVVADVVARAATTSEQISYATVAYHLDRSVPYSPSRSATTSQFSSQ